MDIAQSICTGTGDTPKRIEPVKVIPEVNVEVDSETAYIETNFDLSPWDESTKLVLKLYNDRNDVDIENDNVVENTLIYTSDDVVPTFFEQSGVFLTKDSQRGITVAFDGSALIDFKLKVISIETNGRQDYP